MIRLTLTALLLISTASIHVGCRTTPSSLNSEVDSLDPVKELESFDYRVDAKFNKLVGERIGCDNASRWVSYPKEGRIQDSIRNILASEWVYDSVLREFFDTDANKIPCDSQSRPSKASDAGLRSLLKWNKSQYPGEILTIIGHGGFGTHLIHERTLDSSVVGWFEYIDDGADLDLWQIECSNSFAPDERCAEEMIEKIQEREIATDTVNNRRYLLWGYSRGGNTILEALRTSEKLRNRTIGVVTVSAPIGGSVALERTEPRIADYTNFLAQGLGIADEVASQIPLQFLVALQYLNNEETVLGRLAELLTDSEIKEIQRGTKSFGTKARSRYLKNKFQTSDFRRNDGSSISVFHFASLLDISTLTPNYSVRSEGGRLVPNRGRFRYGDIISLLFSKTFIDYPLSNAFVALQHSVIPRKNTPVGLKPRLVGLLLFDHFTSRLSPPEGREWEVPNVGIIDAIMEYVGTELEVTQ